jgi:hypothetical protein
MPASSAADVFGPISLLSTTPSEQVVYAHDPAVAADGRYVAFDGDFGGLTGVWRRAIGGSAIEPVSVGPSGTPLGSAELPSISAEGRYVSFTTRAQLDPADDTNNAPDVYVRDMSDSDTEPCAEATEAERSEGLRPPCSYTLVSAQNHSTAGLDYTYGGSPASEEPDYGSIAAGRSAISADGREVAFVTTAVSNLAGAGTPALQVAVRDLATDSTQLVSVRYDPATGAPAVSSATGEEEPVSSREGIVTYGAVFTGAGATLPPFREPQAREAPLPIGASISADGSAVAWMGTNVGLQAPVLEEEARSAKYSEPLWRRIADGPAAPVRRVTGGGDPLDPACAASGQLTLPSPASATDPCQGPLATFTDRSNPGVVSGVEGDDDVIPRLSADGYAVAFLSNAPLVALGEGFGTGDTRSDLYVADMHPGLERLQALQPLTEPASGNLSDLATTAPIVDFAISPDASNVAFTTKRTQFPLTSPAFVSEPATSPGMNELYDADIADDTLTRVTTGFEGGPSEYPHEPARAGEDPYTVAGDGALSPSFTGDGNTLVFSSTASNLVYGDGNTPPPSQQFGPFDGSDVFSVSRVIFSAAPPPQSISTPPPNPAPVPAWALGVTASSRSDGSVLLSVEVPGAGTLRATARGTVVVRETVSAHRARRRGARSSRSSARLASTSVATTTIRTTLASLAQLRLALVRRYAALAERSGGLPATVTVTFSAPGHTTLRQSVEVLFVRHPKHHAARRRSPRRSRG